MAVAQGPGAQRAPRQAADDGDADTIIREIVGVAAFGRATWIVVFRTANVRQWQKTIDLFQGIGTGFRIGLSKSNGIPYQRIPCLRERVIGFLLTACLGSFRGQVADKEEQAAHDKKRQQGDQNKALMTLRPE